MRTIRLFAAGAIVLVAIYYVFRAVASRCAGAACDAYIPVSALLPLLVFLAVAIAAALATVREGRSGRWFLALLVLTILGVLGPLVALFIFRNNPDAFVAVATVVELLIAFSVLVYTARFAAP